MNLGTPVPSANPNGVHWFLRRERREGSYGIGDRAPDLATLTCVLTPAWVIMRSERLAGFSSPGGGRAMEASRDMWLWHKGPPVGPQCVDGPSGRRRFEGSWGFQKALRLPPESWRLIRTANAAVKRTDSGKCG